MKKIINFLIIILIVTFNFNIKIYSMENKKLYDIEIESITGETISLNKYKGKTILLVNWPQQSLCSYLQSIRLLLNEL